MVIEYKTDEGLVRFDWRIKRFYYSKPVSKRNQNMCVHLALENRLKSRAISDGYAKHEDMFHYVKREEPKTKPKAKKKVSSNPKEKGFFIKL